MQTEENMKYKFRYRENGTICEFDAWDVAEMVRSVSEWECLDDVSDLLLGDAAQHIPRTVNVIERRPVGRPRKIDVDDSVNSSQ
jgi:hypothetical protein